MRVRALYSRDRGGRVVSTCHTTLHYFVPTQLGGRRVVGVHFKPIAGFASFFWPCLCVLCVRGVCARPRGFALQRRFSITHEKAQTR